MCVFVCVSVCARVCVCVCFVVIVHWHCSAQLSMFNMEKRYRNKIIIIIITYQHVFSQPSLPSAQVGPYPQGQTLLAQEGIASVAAAEGTDLVLLRQVSHHQHLGVTRPVVVQLA